jgi:hypothetical protein
MARETLNPDNGRKADPPAAQQRFGRHDGARGA